MPDSLKAFTANCQQRVDQTLEALLPAAEGAAARLYQAMRYSVFNGGKRIRPVLCFAAAHAVSTPNNDTHLVAASLELIHAYSLIHDDLPAMDDDDLRRGKPTCHIAYDEATAILAGDALQTLAFETLAKLDHFQPRLLKELSHAAGASGMVGGQAMDIYGTNKNLPLDDLKQMHRLKTGALINASILMGAISTNSATDQQLSRLSHYGELIGLAFQVQDDVLDVESDTETLGKNQGADLTLNKSTFTSLLGVKEAKETAIRLSEEAITALDDFDHNADTLRQLASFIVSRKS